MRITLGLPTALGSDGTPDTSSWVRRTRVTTAPGSSLRPSCPSSTPVSSRHPHCGQLTVFIMMPFMSNLPGLEMNCGCCSFYLCRIATRVESQLITFSLESRGPFVPGSAMCVMGRERGRLRLASGELHDRVKDELEDRRGRASGEILQVHLKSKRPLISQLLAHFPSFGTSDGSMDTSEGTT